MAIPYQLSPLYDLIVKTRIKQDLPEEATFGNQILAIQESIISSLEAERKRSYPEEEFREFINDHYLSLVDYKDRLFRITEPHYSLICVCIDNLKNYMLLHHEDILNTSPGTENLPVAAAERFSDRIRRFFSS